MQRDNMFLVFLCHFCHETGFYLFLRYAIKRPKEKTSMEKNVEEKRPKKICRWKICRKIFVDDKNVEKLISKKKISKVRVS